MKDLFDIDPKGFKKLMEETSQPLVWEEYEDLENRTYPFWKIAIANQSDTRKEFLEWLKTQKSYKAFSKKHDLTHIITPPKAAFDVDVSTKTTVSNDYKVLITKNIEDLKNLPKEVKMVDKTGAVKPKADMGKQNVPDIKDSKLSSGKTTLKNNKVGINKPSPKFDKLPETKIKDSKLGKNDKTVLNDNVGVVVPKISTEFGGKKAKIKFDFDNYEYTEPTVVHDWDSTLLEKFNKISNKPD